MKKDDPSQVTSWTTSRKPKATVLTTATTDQAIIGRDGCRPAGHSVRPPMTMMRVMSQSKPAKSRVNLGKQMAEIVRLRQEMRAKTPEQRKTTTRAVARILDDVHLEGRLGKF